MIRRYPSSGSAYTYAQNPSTQRGLYGGLVIMAGLFAITDGQYHSGGIYLDALFPNVNHWVWVIILTAFYDWHQPTWRSFCCEL